MHRTPIPDRRLPRISLGLRQTSLTLDPLLLPLLVLLNLDDLKLIQSLVVVISQLFQLLNQRHLPLQLFVNCITQVRFVLRSLLGYFGPQDFCFVQLDVLLLG